MSAPMIELSGVSKSFGSLQVLRDIDLSVDKSEVVCLIGPSGSGKSTLLRCVNFLESYDAGEIRIEGRLIGYEDRPGAPRRLMRGRELRELRCEIGMVFQHFNLWPHLSGGQQQRVAIARALAMQPRLMLFDEPTSALDPELVGEVLEVMRGLASEGMTMLIVTHEMGFAAKVADRIAFLDGGRIVEQGPPRQVFHESNEPRVRQFLQTYHDRNSF